MREPIFSIDELSRFQSVTKEVSEELNKGEADVTVKEVIDHIEKKGTPAYQDDPVFYRYAVLFLGIAIVISIIALTFSIYRGNGGTEGLIAVASGGIGALAGLFGAQKK